MKQTRLVQAGLTSVKYRSGLRSTVPLKNLITRRCFTSTADSSKFSFHNHIMKPLVAVPSIAALLYRAWSRKSLTPLALVIAGLTASVHALHPWSVFFALLGLFFLSGTAVTKVCDSLVFSVYLSHSLFFVPASIRADSYQAVRWHWTKSNPSLSFCGPGRNALAVMLSPDCRGSAAIPSAAEDSMPSPESMRRNAASKWSIQRVLNVNDR